MFPIIVISIGVVNKSSATSKLLTGQFFYDKDALESIRYIHFQSEEEVPIHWEPAEKQDQKYRSHFFEIIYFLTTGRYYKVDNSLLLL